jgi:hypothetical protein
MRSLVGELRLVHSNLAARAAGLPLLPSRLSQAGTQSIRRDIPDLTHVMHCLRLLDGFLLGQWATQNLEDEIEEGGKVSDSPTQNMAKEVNVEDLVALCVFAEIITKDVDYEQFHDTGKLTFLYLGHY